ncbi:unnamed protein product [Echinostoma caproni]|uniref:RING-type domain-containing protein n=1 Tax=Echinostoma caproni TaxID=27848 RepID=A0A183AB88_9TREM|nr:unnamed protein product [Echinostoma caproni]
MDHSVLSVFFQNSYIRLVVPVCWTVLSLLSDLPGSCGAAHASHRASPTTTDPTGWSPNMSTTADGSDETIHRLGRIKLGLAAAFFFSVLLVCGLPIVLIDWLQKKDAPVYSSSPRTSGGGVGGGSGRRSPRPLANSSVLIRGDRSGGDLDADSPSDSPCHTRSPTDISWPNGLPTGRRSPRSQLHRPQQPKVSTTSEPLSTPNQSPNPADAEHTDLLTGALVPTNSGGWPHHPRRHHDTSGHETRRAERMGARLRRTSVGALRSFAMRKMLLRRWFSRLNCFAAGIFLSSGFMELYVDVEESIEEAKTQLNVTSEFPFAPFLTLIGFFLVLSLEQIIWTVRLSRHESPASARPSVTSITRDTDLPSPCGNGCFRRGTKADESVESPQTAISPLNTGNHFTFTDEIVMPSVPTGTTTVTLTPTCPDPFDYEPTGDLFSGNRLRRSSKPELVLDQNHTPTSPTHPLHNHADYNHSSHYTRHHRHSQHQHSHLPSADSLTSFGALLQVVVLLCAMSVHSLFEGLAVGLQSTVQHTLSLFSAILLHKLIIAAGIGVNLATATTTSDSSPASATDSPGVGRPSVVNRRLVAYQSLATLIFAGSSPLGVLIGWALIRDAQQSGTLLMSTAILQGLACGTFFFVVFCELLPTEFREGVGDRLGKVLFLILGFLMVALYSFFMPH